MAHSLSNLVLKRILGSPCSVRQMVSVIRQNRGFSNLPNDPDTHEDFQPTSKTAGASISYKDIIEQDVKESPVMIYMKGHPQAPRCGFSALAVRVLVEYGVPINSRNILEDHDFKRSVKDFSHWPTFPQIFIRGEFIGGSDILLDMHKTGELKKKLKGISDQATD